MYKKSVTSSKRFRRKYPVGARELACVPMILRDGAYGGASLPYPSMRHIKDLTDYAGIAYGTVRTNLSRLRKDGRIAVAKDDAGRTRYRMTESAMNMGRASLDRAGQPSGFLLAVFSFAADDIDERNYVRETLKYYGFKKLAQNTYINGRIDTSSLRAAVKEAGLEEHLYLFHCPDVDDPELVGRILSLFDIEGRDRFLREFFEDLKDFLDVESLDLEEALHRLCYAGPVHWKTCFRDEPPIPPAHLPEGYPLGSIVALYDELIESYRASYIERYVALDEEP